MTIPAPLRAAAILHWITAVGFGVFCVPAIRNLLSGRDIPIVLGYPAYGRGPFERVGIPTTVALLTTFLLVCMLEAVAGFFLWRGSPCPVPCSHLCWFRWVLLVGVCLADSSDLRPRLDRADSPQLEGPPMTNEGSWCLGLNVGFDSLME
jgi:hypothetical protein